MLLLEDGMACVVEEAWFLNNSADEFEDEGRGVLPRQKELQIRHNHSPVVAVAIASNFPHKREIFAELEENISMELKINEFRTSLPLYSAESFSSWRQGSRLGTPVSLPA